MLHYVEFEYDDGMFLALGYEQLSLPVYRKVEHGFIRKPGYYRYEQLRWPSWTKFVPIDNFVYIDEGMIAVGEVQDRWGIVEPFPKDERTEVEKVADAVRRRQSGSN